MSPRPIELPESEFEPAVQLAREGRFAEALGTVEEVLVRRDRETVATRAATTLSAIARLAVAADEWILAERALELATELRPRFPDLHHQMACVRLARSKYSEARRALVLALELNPRYAAARLELALLDAREGQLGESLASLRSLAADVRLEDPSAFQQGLRRLERAEWEEAEPLLKQALADSDPWLRERLERFREHLEHGEHERAAHAIAEMLPRHEAYPDLHYLMGLAELKLGYYDDALASFARALELNPGFHEARIQLAQALECLGASNEAAEQVTLVLEHDPGNALALELERTWTERGARDRRVKRRAGAAVARAQSASDARSPRRKETRMHPRGSEQDDPSNLDEGDGPSGRAA